MTPPHARAKAAHAGRHCIRQQGGAHRLWQQVDFGKTASDYARHRAGFPDRLFDRLATLGWIRPGMTARDLGTGTGSLARGLALRGLRVTGIDIAAPLLAEAAELGRQAGVEVTYRIGAAEALAEPDRSLDLVAAGQCWHWFDRARAAAEAGRVLRPGGRLIIPHFDWLPLADNVVEITETLILAANPAWAMAGGTGLYPGWLADLAEAGFVALETFSFDVDVSFTHEAWRGRIRASAGVRASLTAPETEGFDKRLAEALTRHFPLQPLHVPHRVWVASGVKPDERMTGP